MKKVSITAIVFVSLLILDSVEIQAGDTVAKRISGGITTDNAGTGSREDEPGGTLGEKSGDKMTKDQEKRKTSRKESVIQREAKPRRISNSFIDPSRTEYVALFIGYGGYFPVADYGRSYDPGHLVSFTAGVYYINFLGLSPELHLRYAVIDFKDDSFRCSASLSQVQVYPAIVYRYRINLPRNSLTVYGRIWDGLSMTRYESRDPYFLAVTRNIRENLNVFGLSAGCYYDVWRGFLVGVDVSYSIVSTARKPLQSFSFTVNAGWRIL